MACRDGCFRRQSLQPPFSLQKNRCSTSVLCHAVGYWVLASIVLMHIVRIKLEAPSNREQTAHVDFCSAPFFILALVVHLYARVWGWVIGAYYSWFLYFKLVTIAPLKSSITPIESGLPVSDILQRIPKRVT